ncbi:hypothetical protein DMA11_23600 [Marinilabiliaceae bacterium JC017]|nr:hypothetical protein DMA11_23600 [Marinilabiliaceae bacterium JC017]
MVEIDGNNYLPDGSFGPVFDLTDDYLGTELETNRNRWRYFEVVGMGLGVRCLDAGRYRRLEVRGWKLER